MKGVLTLLCSISMVLCPETELDETSVAGHACLEDLAPLFVTVPVSDNVNQWLGSVVNAIKNPRVINGEPAVVLPSMKQEDKRQLIQDCIVYKQGIFNTISGDTCGSVEALNKLISDENSHKEYLAKHSNIDKVVKILVACNMAGIDLPKVSSRKE